MYSVGHRHTFERKKIIRCPKIHKSAVGTQMRGLESYLRSQWLS